MKEFVLDNSIVMRWLFNDGTPTDLQFSYSLLEIMKESTVWVPNIWPLEAMNVIMLAVHKGLLVKTAAFAFLNTLSQMEMQVDSEVHYPSMTSLLSLITTHQLSSYDASYIAVAIHKGIPLCTLDKAMQKAAHKMGIELGQQKLRKI